MWPFAYAVLQIKDCKRARLGASKKDTKITPVAVVEAAEVQDDTKNKTAEETCKTGILESQETMFSFSAEVEDKMVVKQCVSSTTKEENLKTPSCETNVLLKKQSIIKPLEPLIPQKKGLIPAFLCF